MSGGGREGTEGEEDEPDEESNFFIDALTPIDFVASDMERVFVLVF